MKEIEPKNEASDDSPGTGQLVSSNINETISTNTKLLRKISVERPLNNKRYGMFPCDQCDYQATRIDNLNQHIKSQHEGIKYACNQCTYHASRPSNLRNHARKMHEGFKYYCDQCDYKATEKKYVLAHTKSKHN